MPAQLPRAPVVLALLLLCCGVETAPSTFTRHRLQQLLEWTGRIHTCGRCGAGWTIDWEGTRVRATVCNATKVSAVSTDTTPGGARFGVWVNASLADPHAANVPNLRVSTVHTSEGFSLNYALASRAAIRESPACVTYTLQLLVELYFMQDSGPASQAASALTVKGLLTDGHLVATPEPAVKRAIEILGDKPHCGQLRSWGGKPHCGPWGGVRPPALAAQHLWPRFTDDQEFSYGALLCANFSARCTTEAVFGITLHTRPGASTCPSCGTGSWAACCRTRGMAEGEHGVLRRAALPAPLFESIIQPDAVLINLGENDWGGGKCGSIPGCPANFTAAYVEYVRHISDVYGRAGKKEAITFFLTIGPHEHGQSAAIVPAVGQLKAGGVKAVFLNATVPDYSTIGCGGHPGITIHHASFMRAQPIIAAAMGW